MNLNEECLLQYLQHGSNILSGRQALGSQTLDREEWPPIFRKKNYVSSPMAALLTKLQRILT